MEELSSLRLQLRFCPTKVMAADGLTKLATSQVMEDFRKILHGKPFDLPSSSAEFALTNSAAMAGAVLVTQPSFGSLPMIERRRRADAIAFEYISTCSSISDAQIQCILMTWGFAQNTSRKNVAPPSAEFVWSETFGLVYDRVGRWVESTVTRLFPNVAKCLNKWLESRVTKLKHRAFPNPSLDWRWTAITANRGYAATRHVDINNQGPSIIKSIADSSDGLLYWPDGDRRELSSLASDEAVVLPIASNRRMYAFDGRRPHEVRPYTGEIKDRISIVFFLSARGWLAEPSTLQRLSDLGFVPAASAEEAESFETRFDSLTEGQAYTSWKLQL